MLAWQASGQSSGRLFDYLVDKPCWLFAAIGNASNSGQTNALHFKPHRSSRRYLTVPIDVGDVGFVDFLLEAGSYQCLISGELRQRLGIGPGDGAAVRAIDSGGPTLRQRVELPEMWLGEWPCVFWGGGAV